MVVMLEQRCDYSMPQIGHLKTVKMVHFMLHRLPQQREKGKVVSPSLLGTPEQGLPSPSAARISRRASWRKQCSI